ncbi:MAG: RecX family transcriptional regulator [Candidatus Daviesbacteria bacterium]|nr:RecX family transcriptional regulator [Candidatus Daviesbacteria bacterium]
MLTITSVEPQKKNLKRFNIFLDGKFAFGADEDLIVDYRLVVGKIIQTEDLEKLLFEAEVGKLMEKMYNWFCFRQHSEKETRDYLKNLSFKRKLKDLDEISEMVTSLLVERLKKKGLINDLEFAKAWVDARRRSKQKGINAIKSELYQKGIDKEIIEEVIVQASEGDEENLAKIALEKKINSWKNLDEKKRKQKAFEYLMRKGFTYDISKEVIEKLLKMS